MRTEPGSCWQARRKPARGVLAFRENNTALLNSTLCPNITELPSQNVQLLHCLQQEVRKELEFDETVSDSDILHVALKELLLALRSPRREDKVMKLLFWLSERKRKGRPKSKSVFP